MSYHDKILQAIEYSRAHPPTLPDPSEWPQSFDALVSPSESIFSGLHDLPDQAIITFPDTIIQALPNEVIAERVTHAEFSSLVKDYYEIMDAPFDSEMTDAFFRHESQHLAMARRLGAITSIGIAVELLPGVGGDVLADAMRPIIKTANFQTPKLDVALICAYPDQPSSEDLKDIRAMGYNGVNDVAERIIRRGLPGDALPRSYRP